MPLHLQIVSQEGPVFEDDAVDMVIIPGAEGEMGILPHHAALLSTLRPGELRVRKGGAEESFIVYGGVVEVRPDRVIVLADTAESSYEVDEAAAQAARERAEQLMREGVPPDRTADVVRELRRAQLQENVLRRIRTRSGVVRIKTVEDNGSERQQ
ncbi:MAG: ATP synthase F1 subunit epsilon [Anaerolineae bacterium]|nr:ATP synthase F1 subunit epsilon [Anaerolineae bacterium]